jgi:hypothetical protein
MGTRDLISSIAVEDELTTRPVWKPILCAFLGRYDAVPDSRFREIACLNSSYNVYGVEEKPHEPRFNPSLRRQR